MLVPPLFIKLKKFCRSLTVNNSRLMTSPLYAYAVFVCFVFYLHIFVQKIKPKKASQSHCIRHNSEKWSSQSGLTTKPEILILIHV